MLKTTFYSSLFFAVLFGVVSLIFYFGEWYRFLIVVLMGIFVGIVAAPELEPKQFKSPWIFQVVGGFVFGIFLGILMDFSFEGIIASAGISAFLGLTAFFWLKHLPVP